MKEEAETLKNSCSLWINVARTDVSFMMQTIPHLVGMCRHPFLERVLVIETAPLSGEKTRRPGIGTMDDLRSCCASLKERGVVDRIIERDYSDEVRRSVYRKHFHNDRIRATHNWKGYPVFGMMHNIDMASGEYILHFDSDMLLYQEKGFDWIREGIRLMEEDARIVWARPSSGPQARVNNLYTKEYKIAKDPRGFYPIPGFSSRCFLLHKKRFEALLPMTVLWAKRQGRVKDKLPRGLIEMWNAVSGSGFLESWEKIVSRKVVEKGMMSAHIADRAWMLHPPDHGPEFIKALSSIIEKVEKGHFPPEQAGDYDLRLKLWTS